MSRIDEVKEHWNEITERLSSDPNEFKDYLSFAGKTFKYSFADSALIYAQKPNATMIADLPTWNMVGKAAGFPIGFLNFMKGVPAMSHFKLSNKILDLGLTASELHVFSYLYSIHSTTSTLLGDLVKVKQVTIAEKCLVELHLL